MTPYLSNERNYSTPVHLGKLVFALILIVTVVGAGGCTFPGSTSPVIKIGLIAPFEGEQRSDGYQRLYGVKLALQEANLNGGVAGVNIELVALNDNAEEAETILQAQELVLDSKVVAVIGNWDKKLFEAVAPVYQTASLAAINPAPGATHIEPHSGFEADYLAFAGTEPDEQAEQAYLATVEILRMIETSRQESSRINREGIFKVFNDVYAVD